MNHPNRKAATQDQEATSTVSGPNYLGMMLPSDYEGQAYDFMVHAWLGKLYGWLSPASVSLALFDWLTHLAIAPAKQADLSRKSIEGLFNF
ncbi:MAG: poly-beta-hydroxybutyrate polymerase N-terminal domain-containing protein, partial [Pseudomonadota bacterium]